MGKEGEREERNISAKEKQQLVALSPTGNRIHNPGMCPDQESNLQNFSVRSTMPHWPRLE